MVERDKMDLSSLRFWKENTFNHIAALSNLVQSIASRLPQDV
jgi:hypothetical protein